MPMLKKHLVSLLLFTGSRGQGASPGFGVLGGSVSGSVDGFIRGEDLGVVHED